MTAKLGVHVQGSSCTQSPEDCWQTHCYKTAGDCCHHCYCSTLEMYLCYTTLCTVGCLQHPDAVITALYGTCDIEQRQVELLAAGLCQ